MTEELQEAEVQELEVTAQEPEATTEERPHVDLQRRLGTVLSRDNSVGSDELRELIQETEDAATELHLAAHAYGVAALRIECPDPVASKNTQAGLLIERERMELCKLRLQERLAHALQRERREAHAEDFRRVEALVEEQAEVFATRVPALFDELIDIFKQCAVLDKEVERVGSLGGEQLRTVEMAARGIDAFTRDRPSIAATTQLPQWVDSQRLLWPPPRVPMGVLVAEAMSSSPDPQFTDQWASTYEERRAQQAADHQLVADYYDQQRAKEAE